MTRLRTTSRSISKKVLPGLLGAALMISACGSDDGGEEGSGGTDGETAESDDADDSGDSGDGEAVEIRFAWWGSDTRHEETQEIIELFEQEHPNITVTPDFTDWGSYWDRLATSTAGGDAPDVMTQEERYMTDYALRDQLLDLNEVSGSLDLSGIDEPALAGGELEGGQYGVATGVNAFAIIADPQAFDDAGVDMPDDTAWTWQDFADTSAELADSGEMFGIQPDGSNEAGFKIYARQHGEDLYNADGSLAFTAQTLADWWQIQLDLVQSDASPDATELLEIEGPDTSLVATGQGAMTSAYWTNQLGAISDTAGRELELLRYPGESEFQQPGMYLKPAMFYSISSQTEHPEEAAMFVDFLLNDTRAAEIMLTDRGLPANVQVREEIQDLLPETETKVSEFMAEITPELADPPPPPPDGAGEIPEIMTRLWEEVLFEQRTPMDAAEVFISEAEMATGG